jgi:hypothetical protein
LPVSRRFANVFRSCSNTALSAARLACRFRAISGCEQLQ